MRKEFLVASILLLLLGGGSGLRAQKSVQESVPPQGQQQVAVGKVFYQEHCAICHDQGAMSLVGSQALNRLSRYRTAKGLFDYLTIAMPPTNPGGLKEEVYWAILAYLLKENGLLPENTILSKENATTLSIRPRTP